MCNNFRELILANMRVNYLCNLASLACFLEVTVMLECFMPSCMKKALSLYNFKCSFCKVQCGDLEMCGFGLHEVGQRVE